MDEAEWTPLLIAVSGNKGQVVNTLISRGANVNVVNRTGITTLPVQYLITVQSDL